MTRDDGKRVLLAMFGRLVELCKTRHASLLAVLLPTPDDVRRSEADDWGAYLREELSKKDIPFFDLVPALRSEAEATIPSLLRGHYSELGNRWAASRIHRALTALPSLKGRLTPDESQDSAAPAAALERISLDNVQIRSTHMPGHMSLLRDGS